MNADTPLFCEKLKNLSLFVFNAIYTIFKQKNIVVTKKLCNFAPKNRTAICILD